MSDYNEQFDWDSEIELDGEEYITVEPGDYTFTVKKVERKNYAGGKSIPACNMVLVTGEIEVPKGTATFQERMYLVRKNEWKLSAFFRCIGMKKHGEKLRMDWPGSVGRKGRAKFSTRPYEGKEYNQVEQFYDYDAAAVNGGFKEVVDDDPPW